MTQATASTSSVSTPSAPAQVGLWGPTWMLWKREMVRFLRQRTRVVGALGTPVVFWMLLGFGLDRVMPIDTQGGEVGYLAYFFPGTISLIVLFTAIFSTMSAIEDRQAGFLQAVLASPAPRTSIVLGKVLGGASLATMQGVLFLLFWPMVGDELPVTLLLTVPVMFIVAMMLTALGLFLAWPMRSTAGYHAIMNLLLMPMWLLCGAVFPLAQDTPIGMKVLMYLNPLTYGQSLIAWSMGIGSGPNSLASFIILMIFLFLLLSLATRLVAKPGTDGA